MDACVPHNRFHTAHQKMTFHKYKVISPLDCSTLELGFIPWILRNLENKAVPFLWVRLEMFPSFRIQITKQEVDTDFQVAILSKRTDNEKHMVRLCIHPEFSKCFSCINSLCSSLYTVITIDD